MPRNDDDDDGPPSPISPILPSSPPRLPKISTSSSKSRRRQKEEEDLDSDDAISGIEPRFDFDEKEQDVRYNPIVDNSSMSLPAEQRRYLADVDSSFRGSTPGKYTRMESEMDADLSIVGGAPPDRSTASHRPDNVSSRRTTEMGPPNMPASAYRKTSTMSTRPEITQTRSQSRPTSRPASTQRLSSTNSNSRNLDIPSSRSQLNRTPSPNPSNYDLPSVDDDHDEVDNSIMRERRLEDFSSPSVAAQTRSISRAASSQYQGSANNSYQQPTVVTANTTPVKETADTPLHQGVPDDVSFEHKDNDVMKMPKPSRSRRGSAGSISSVGSAQVSDMEQDSSKHRRSKSLAKPNTDVNSIAPELPKPTTRPRPASRNTSFGSVASGITVGQAADRTLERLDEEDRYHNDFVTPTTPQPHSSDDEGDLPPENEINAEVSKVHVPETVARDFQRKHNLMRPNGSPTKFRPPGTASKNMTLKEQSGIIDKLQKENFDLKVKIFHLNAKLDKSSEEGVADLTSENVELRIKIVELGKANRAMRKRIKELEKANGDLEGHSNKSGSDEDEREDSGMTAKEEIIYWKERTERIQTDMEIIRTREVEREGELQKLSELVRGMSGGGEEMEILRDFLESETLRREQAEADNVKLRDDIWKLKAEANPGFAHSNNTTNVNSNRSRSSMSQTGSDVIQQLRNENEDLRRENAAQTSMLTSRNRERERLYQELEEIKLGVMRHGIDDRVLLRPSDSISRDGTVDRSASRISGQMNNQLALTENERDDYENTNGQLRDTISELKLRLQELEIELETRMRDLDNVVVQRQEFGDLAAEYEEELEILNADLMAVQIERNDYAKMREELELDFDALKEEAEEEIQRLEDEIENRQGELNRVSSELTIKEENFNALQTEMRSVSAMVVGLEDTDKDRINKIQQLEDELEKAKRTMNDNESEMTALEKQLVELTEKNDRVGIQHESAQGEIAFLREEQDGDKIKIGQLEGQIKSIEKALEDERERVRSANDRLVEERKLREETRDMKKQEVEKVINEKNQEILNTRETTRQLKKTVLRREQDIKEWKDKLVELENALKEALGESSGTRSGMLKSISNLQQDLERRVDEIGSVRNQLSEKDRTLKERENLMESMALETRKLTDLLDKERQGRKADRALADSLQSTHSQSRRTIAQHQSQLAELEKARNKDSKALIQLEAQYREQLAERNSLLVQLWQRLTFICGADWLHKNPLTKGGDAQSAETVVQSALPSFNKSIILAVKTIEEVVNGFKARCRNIERDLWKEYQIVESTLETRTRRLERLEAMARDGVGEQSAIRTEAAKLRTENRLLKAELNVAKLQPNRMPSKPTSGTSTPTPAGDDTLTATPIPTSMSILNRAYSTTAVPPSDANTSFTANAKSLDDVTDESERRWILRLRELEKRLKAEREARLLDRNGAKLRLEEARGEREELKKELAREKSMSRLGRHDEVEPIPQLLADSLRPPLQRLESSRHRSRDREGGSGGKSRERELQMGKDDDDASIRTTIVRVEKERKDRRRERERVEKGYDTDRDRELRQRERERDGGVDGSGSGNGHRHRDKRLEPGPRKSSISSTPRSSMRRSETAPGGSGIVAKRAVSEEMLKREGGSSGGGGTPNKSPPKKESNMTPRKLLGFLSVNKDRSASKAAADA